MRHLLKVTALAAALGVALAACDGGGDDGGDVVVTPTPPPPVTPTPVRLEDTFGANFGTAFRASTNSEPRDPQAGDLNPVSFTTDPTAIP